MVGTAITTFRPLPADDRRGTDRGRGTRIRPPRAFRRQGRSCGLPRPCRIQGRCSGRCGKARKCRVLLPHHSRNVMGERCVSADDLDRLKAMFLDGEHPHCLYVSDKRSWNTTHNPHCPIRLKEQNRHGGMGCIIPRLWLWRYRRDRYRHSLNLKCDANTVYWYDFV